MLYTSNLVAFVATANPGAARAFYKDSLQLRELEHTPYALVFDANGIKVRIQIVEEVKALPYTVLGWEVEDIDSIVNTLTTNGIIFERFDTLPQDKNGIWTTPDNARVAWFKDPDGNRLSITQTL